MTDIELYRIAVESAEKASDRRMAANAFYAALQGGVLTLFSTVKASSASELTGFVAIVGLGIAVIWFTALNGYRNHNTIKFALICEMEQRLSYQFFSEEERRFSSKVSLLRFTTIERLLPALSGGGFLYLLVFF